MEQYKYDDNYREYKRLFRRFKQEYSELIVRGTGFIPYGYQEILIMIPRKGKLIYNSVGSGGTKIRWVEGPHEDERELKQREREMRPDMYQNFLREIDWYQKITGASQGDIARLTGVSRQSINKYLSGVNSPKVSTMIKIADALGIDI